MEVGGDVYMKRRAFLQALAGASVAAMAGCAARPSPKEPWLMSVRGRLPARDLGVTLTHEHALANFQSHEEWVRAPRHYDRDVVVRHVLPHLQRIRSLGCRSFVDATAVGLGRDPVLLRRLSEESGLHILTVTGNYAAFDEKFVPRYVRDEDVESLAARWIRDFTQGIDGTDVKPGFIKLGFNGGALSEVELKLIRAAARAHRATGLTIGAHTRLAASAFQQLAELDAAGVHPSAWIWIHAQEEPDPRRYDAAAKRGAWISLDGVSPATLDAHLDRVAGLRDRGFLDRVLVSQDAGWYSVGEPDGGTFRPYDTVFTQFIPALRARGFSQAEIRQIFVTNPAAAFAVGVRDL
jgi:predicted metal-dependent phosphotriesterase family hydrolase